MKASSRKIFKKIGAGLMLGLSLFNLGAAWNKAEGWNIAKRSKKLRVKEQDQVESELAMFAEVAEEEAERAIREQSAFRQEQVIEKTEVNLLQKIYRFSAVGIISVALAFFATSMIFNFPFALGKGFLSLLPGLPHLAVLSLTVNENKIDFANNLTVVANLDSSGEKVDKIKLVISYNPNLVFFENYNASMAGWEIRESQISDNKRNLIALIDEDHFDSRIFSKEDLMEINFIPKELAIGHDVVFSVSQPRSLVIAKENGHSRNILGDTNGAKVFVSENVQQAMKCQKVENPIGTVEYWKGFVRGDLLSLRDDYWQKIDDSTGMICAHDGEYSYITIVASKNNDIDVFKINSSQFKEEIKRPEYFWTEGDFNFYLYQVSSDKISDSEIDIRIESEFFNKKQWPIAGSGKVIFE